MDFKNHDLELPDETPGLLYEKIPLRDPGNEPVPVPPLDNGTYRSSFHPGTVHP